MSVLEKIKEFWFSSKVYHFEENIDKSFNLKSAEDLIKIKSNVFSVDTPPPTVSGTLHIGHVFSYSHADFIARYQRMIGKDVFYPIGFDDNGLPTERLVEKVKKIRGIDYAKTGKKDEFIAECQSVIDSSEKDFEKLFKDLGYSFDWTKKYQTISKKTEKISHFSFLDLFKKDLIYFSNKPSYWDCEDQTAIAQTEIEDAERDANEYYLKFYFTDENFVYKGKNYLEIMTTRPELLCNCYWVFINPNDERVKDLIGKKLKVPVFENEVEILTDEDAAIDKGTGLVMCCAYGNMQDYKWIERNYFKIQKEVKEVISKDGKIIDEFYKFTKENGETDYLRIKKAQEKIAESLKEKDLIEKTGLGEFKINKIKQIVKIAERSKTPLEIITTNQCYLKLLDFKEDFLVLVEELEFFPSHLKSRLIQWIEGINQDWCISRNRFMGINPPAKEKLREILMERFLNENIDAKIKNIDLNFVFDTWFTSSVSPQINSRFISENFKDEEFLNENKNFNQLIYPFSIRPQAHEIIRTWTFTTIAKAYLHGLSDENLKKRSEFLKNKNHEGIKKIDLIKKWLSDEEFGFGTDCKKVIKKKFLPWENVILSGWCLAEDKTKMSKSAGNIIDPINLLKDKSPDTIRYWSASSSLGTDTPFNSEKVENGKKLVNKLKNAFRFISMQFEGGKGSLENLDEEIKKNLKDFNFSEDFEFNLKFENKDFNFEKFNKIAKKSLFDKFYLNKFVNVVKDYQELMNKFEFARAKEEIENFFWKDFCDNYLEIAKTRSYGLSALIYKEKSLSNNEKIEILEKQKSALVTLLYIFEGILKLFSPFLPFICEEINLEALQKNSTELNEKNSIHRKGNWFNFTNLERLIFTNEEEESCQFALEIIDFIRKEKSKNNLSIKAEVKTLEIENKIHENLIEDFSSTMNINPENIIKLDSGVFKRIIF